MNPYIIHTPKVKGPRNPITADEISNNMTFFIFPFVKKEIVKNIDATTANTEMNSIDSDLGNNDCMYLLNRYMTGTKNITPHMKYPMGSN